MTDQWLGDLFIVVLVMGADVSLLVLGFGWAQALLIVAIAALLVWFAIYLEELFW